MLGKIYYHCYYLVEYIYQKYILLFALPHN